MLLVLAAILGVPISAAYGFLALVSYLQKEIFTHLPHGLGFSTEPVWWPLPALARGWRAGRPGHPVPAGERRGLTGRRLRRSWRADPGSASRRHLRGAGNPGLRCRARHRDAADRHRRRPGRAGHPRRQAAEGARPGVRVLASAGSFTAIATLLGSPITGAFLLREASGLAGPMLGWCCCRACWRRETGSLIFIGLDNLTGLGTFSLALPGLPCFSQPTVAESAGRWRSDWPPPWSVPGSGDWDASRRPMPTDGPCSSCRCRAWQSLRSRSFTRRRPARQHPTCSSRDTMRSTRSSRTPPVTPGCLRRVAEQLPGRTHLPGHVHRHRRGHRPVSPARATADSWCRDGHRRPVRGDAHPAADLGAARYAAAGLGRTAWPSCRL